MVKRKRVLVACEYSGRVRDAFRRHGWDAWSCDFEETEIPGQHVRGDVRRFLDKNWDLLIAHPPCTRLCNSGVRWLEERNLWNDMEEAALFFKLLLDAPVKRIAVENPIMHKYAVKIVGRKADQIIQPWMFGHGETKATCLWLKNLSLLQPTEIVDGREQRVHKMSPGPDRWKERSRTFQGIADAMAEQWG